VLEVRLDMAGSFTRFLVQLAMLLPIWLIALGTVVAVIGKTVRRFPFQPDETRFFARPTLPRWYSKIYVVAADRFTCDRQLKGKR
jgi:hypothetical protein